MQKKGCLTIGCGSLLGLFVLLLALGLILEAVKSPEQKAAEEQEEAQRAAESEAARAARAAERAKEERLISARGAVRRYVTNRMKSPSTAEVEIRQAGYGVDGKIRMIGHVDAQNSFGATLRNQWIIELSENGEDFNVDSFTLLEVVGS